MYYSSKGSRSNSRENLCNPYTGETILICARNYQSLQNKINAQRNKWEKEHQEKLLQDECDELNRNANEIKEKLLNLYKYKTKFSVNKYYDSLIQVYIKPEFTTCLIEPVYSEPEIIKTAIKENKFLEFFSKKRKEKRLKQENEDFQLNEIRRKNAKEKFKEDFFNYENLLRIEKENFENEQEIIKNNIEVSNRKIEKRRRDYVYCYPDETISLAKEYFNSEIYPDCVKEDFQNVVLKYDDLRKNLFITVDINLSMCLPEYWTFEFKGLNKGINKLPWKHHERKDNYLLILRSLMAKTIYDIFQVFDDKHVDDISYTCYLTDTNKTKVGFCNITRASITNVYKLFEQTLKYFDLKGIIAEDELTKENDPENISDDVLFDLLDEITGNENSNRPSISLDYNENVLLQSLVYLSSMWKIGCKPYYKTIFSFVTGNIKSPFYNSFKLNELFGCLPKISNDKLQNMLDQLVNLGLVICTEINLKNLYYPKNN